MRVLLIKMSSLGDVVHALVGVTDAARAKPGIVFDWVVEEAYADIPKWHPSVRRTIVAPLRRWRKAPLNVVLSGELKAFRNDLRREEHDLVLDAQGLLKSAVVGQQARGPLVGRNAKSAREPAAALLYGRRVAVDTGGTEVEQLRELFAGAIGYERPQTPADFGIDRGKFQGTGGEPYAVFLHGAAWESKLWPEERWIELGRFVRGRGLRVLLPWGNESERARAEGIAQAVNGEVANRMNVAELAALLANARLVAGLDTGLTHIAVAVGARTVTLYGPSVPVYEQVAGELVNLCSTESKVVDTSRPNTVDVEKVIGTLRSWL